jgi:phosphoenolpyruvate-protein phosphotransferase (PTS system enzyme I)
MTEISGVGVSPGRTVGRVVRMPDPVPEPSAEARLPGEADRDEVAARISKAAEGMARPSWRPRR